MHGQRKFHKRPSEHSGRPDFFGDSVVRCRSIWLAERPEGSEDSRRPALYGMSLGQLREAAAGLGLPRYAAGQMASWLYRRGCTDIAAMTDLSKAAREALASSYRLGLRLPGRWPFRVTERKIPLPYGRRALRRIGLYSRRRPGHALRLFTGGVPHGVPFLHDGASGLRGQLTSGDILNQMASLPERGRLTNMVYMGMGSRWITPTSAAFAGNTHRGVGVWLESDPYNGLDRRSGARPAPPARRKPGACGRQSS